MTSLAWLSAWLLASIAADTVSVAVQPLDDRASFAIIEACNRALDETRCVVEGSPDAPSTTAPSTTVPIVPVPPIKQTPPAITRVRVALSSAELERAAIAFESGGVLSEPRILEFDAADPVEERFRAIGLVIAARLLEESAARKGKPPAPERSAAPAPPKRRRFGLETAIFIGQGLDEGKLRWGLRSRALVRPFASVPVSALFAVRLATASQSDDLPKMRWIDLGLGVQGAVPFVKDTLALELHAEGAYQIVTAALEDRATGRTEDGTERRTGAFVGAQLAWTPWPFWGLFIGAESSLFWPPLVLEVRRSEVAKEDPLKLAAHLGQRLSF